MVRQLCIGILLLLISGCYDEKETVSIAPHSERITFGIKLTDGLESTTKGSMVEESNQMGAIGVYCANTTDKLWSVQTSFDKLDNRQLAYIDDEWQLLGEVTTWDSGDDNRYSFYGYSPYVTDDNGITPSIINGSLVIDYTMPTTCTAQPDLMVATPIKDIETPSDGNVALTFNHALSAIGFSVIGDATDIVKSISLRNIVPTARLTIADNGTITWQELSERATIDYTAGINENLLPELYTPTDLMLTDGYLMVIPQDIESVELVVVTYNTDSKSNTSKTFTFENDEKWEIGMTYQYTINLASYDYTIEGTANCYMLHSTDTEQIIYIPVEGRINTFWRYYADDNETYKDKLSSADIWDVEVLWHDVEGGLSGFSAERVTSGFSPSKTVTYRSAPDFTTLGTRSAMKITLPANISEGNILLGVTLEDEIVWSWHLWVTDYNPDAIVAQVSAVASQYNYSVGGIKGEVHRYGDNDLWGTGGIYADKFIMDRDLGARSVEYSEKEVGVLHYQFGRKDPFPVTTVGGSISSNRRNEQVSFLTAAQNPTTFYTRSSYSYSWSIEGEAYSNSYLWDDKNVPYIPNPTAYSKPFFDPSPLGWKIPIYGTYTMLTDDNCKQNSNRDGLVYNDIAQFPYTGYRSNNSGNVKDYGSQGNLRLATAKDNSSGYNLSYTISITMANNTRADGFAIRCIEE